MAEILLMLALNTNQSISYTLVDIISIPYFAYITLIVMPRTRDWSEVINMFTRTNYFVKVVTLGDGIRL